jgi:hypothetical protein
MASKMKLTTGLLTFMILLGVADAALFEGIPVQEKKEIAIDEPIANPTPTPSLQNPTGGVRRDQGPNIAEVLKRRQFTMKETNEKIILQKIIPTEEATLTSYVLLKDGDRAGMIAWTNSSKVKQYYLVLKEALHSAFTANVQDLLDETQRREGRPTRNLLTFFDPGLLSERVVFVRVREQLYEFHIPEGSSGIIFDLIEELTK